MSDRVDRTEGTDRRAEARRSDRARDAGDPRRFEDALGRALRGRADGRARDRGPKPHRGVVPSRTAPPPPPQALPPQALARLRSAQPPAAGRSDPPLGPRGDEAVRGAGDRAAPDAARGLRALQAGEVPPDALRAAGTAGRGAPADLAASELAAAAPRSGERPDEVKRASDAPAAAADGQAAIPLAAPPPPAAAPDVERVLRLAHIAAARPAGQEMVVQVHPGVLGGASIRFVAMGERRIAVRIRSGAARPLTREELNGLLRHLEQAGLIVVEVRRD